MDLTICVMLSPRGDVTFDRSAHSKMPVLSPVCVYPLQQIDEVRAPRTGYIHVTGCPVQSAGELAERLCVPDEREVFVSAERQTQTLAKRLYEADPSLLPLKVRAVLLADRQCAMSWEEFSAMYASRVSAQKLGDVVKADDGDRTALR